MRGRSRSICLAVFALLISLCSFAAVPLAASATDVVLSGTVTGSTGGKPAEAVGGAKVEVLDSATHALVAQTTTAADGGYSMTVATDTYDVRVTPPSGSPFSPTTVANEEVNADKTLNFLLLGANDSTFSGTVKEASGSPAAGVRVQTYGPLDQGVAVERNAYTAADGTFSTSGLAPGKYEIILSGQGEGRPSFWQMITYKTIAEDSTANLKLPPLVKVDVRVADQNGDPVPNTAIRLNAHASAYEMGPGLPLDPTSNSYSIADATTDSAGVAHLLMFPTDAAPSGGRATPSGGGYSQAVFAVPALTGDTTLEVTLIHSLSFSGTVKEASGSPAAGVRVQTYGPLDQGVAVERNAYTAADGTFSTSGLAPGKYEIILSGQGEGRPSFWQMITYKTIAEDSTANLKLPPLVKVDVRVADQNGDPVPNTAIRLNAHASAYEMGPGLPLDPTSNSYSIADATTDSAGVAHLLMFPTDAAPSGGRATPSGGGYSQAVFAVPALTGDTTLAISLQNDQPPPLVSEVSPDTGPEAGGTEVTISGVHLNGATAVRFGSATAASFTVNSPTSIAATAPAGTGTVDVTVVTSSGTSSTNSSDRYRYGPPVTLSSAPNPSVRGAKVTFTAKVTPATPGAPVPAGSVTFVDGATTLGTAVLSKGTATLNKTGLGAGEHEVVAVYGGNAYFGPSESAPLVQTVARASTELTLTSSLNPAPYGSGGTLKASVKAVAPGTGTPTGSVTFSEGETVFATVPLSAGSAKYALKAVEPGSHAITASFNGSTDYEPSESSIAQVVEKAASQLTLTSSLNPAPYGSSATLSAVVKAVPPGAGKPPGTVTFSEGSTVLATVSLSGTTAKYALKTLAPGNHKITATYSGDPHYEASDASIAVTIAKAATTLTLTSSKNPAPKGSSGTLKATVKVVAPGGGTPPGVVTFSEGETVLAVVPLAGASATYPLKSLAPGVHEITAAYGGNANYEASLAMLSQGINP